MKLGVCWLSKIYRKLTKIQNGGRNIQSFDFLIAIYLVLHPILVKFFADCMFWQGLAFNVGLFVVPFESL